MKRLRVLLGGILVLVAFLAIPSPSYAWSGDLPDLGFPTNPVPTAVTDYINADTGKTGVYSNDRYLSFGVVDNVSLPDTDCENESLFAFVDHDTDSQIVFSRIGSDSAISIGSKYYVVLYNNTTESVVFGSEVTGNFQSGGLSCIGYGANVIYDNQYLGKAYPGYAQIDYTRNPLTFGQAVQLIGFIVALMIAGYFINLMRYRNNDA